MSTPGKARGAKSAQAPERTRAIALAVAIITGFMAPFMSSALNLSITSISAEFNSAAGLSTWIVNSYTLATAAFSIGMGRLADLTGRRRMILVGTTLYLACAILCICSQSIQMLIVTRFLMGVSAAVLLSSNVPLALTYYPPQVKGRILGWTVSAVQVGILCGPSIGGLVNSSLGWRWIFAIGIALSVIAIFLALKLDDDSIAGKLRQMDLRGNLLFICSICLIMYGLSELTAQPWAWCCIVAGGILLVLFAFVEWRTAEPVIQVRLFAESPAYSMSNLATLLSFASVFAVGYCTPIFLQNAQGLNSALAGLVMISQPAMQVLVSPIAGRLSDRISSHLLASLGLFICTAGLVMFLFLTPSTPLLYIIGALLLIGLGAGVFASPNTNAVLSCVDRAHYSEANSTISTMRGIGQSVSMAYASLVLSSILGTTTFSQAESWLIAHATTSVMGICVVISVLAALLSLVRRHR